VVTSNGASQGRKPAGRSGLQRVTGADKVGAMIHTTPSTHGILFLQARMTRHHRLTGTRIGRACAPGHRQHGVTEPTRLFTACLGRGAVTVPPALQAQVSPGMTSPPQYLAPHQVQITTDQNLIDARKQLPGALLSGAPSLHLGWRAADRQYGPTGPSHPMGVPVGHLLRVVTSTGASQGRKPAGSPGL